MTSIIPISNTRITGLLARQRLTQQYQTDQLDLFRIQEQISTGLRISLPSQDAPAALRAISFKRLLSRKEQLGSNINSGLLFLGSTDNALGGEGGVADTLNKIKAETLGVVGTVATDQERQAAIQAINEAISNLVNLGNRQANGRFLFAGSETSQPPYSFEDGNVVYNGDDREIQNYLDIGVLFSSNISGQEVFGGISSAVEGQADLTPALSDDTLLSSLRGGRGINPNGSLQIADATDNTVSIVDLSSATTVGDVAKLIEENPPAGTEVNVTVTGDGIEVALASGNLLVINEVGTGTTARELGLLANQDRTPLLPGTVTSEVLDPQLLKTSRLENLLGTKARAVLTSGTGDDNNDIFIEANANGTALNGVNIVVADSPTGPFPDVQFGAGALTITIDENGETTANEVIDAINAEGTFRAELDRGDTSDPADAGTGPVTVSSTTFTDGGGGETLDQSSGIRVVNGGQTYDITFDDDETVEDLLNTLNLSEAGLLAEINEAGTGINIRSRLSGNDFSIGEINGGTTATQLGIRTYGEDSRLSDFNFGVGVPTFGGFELPVGEGVDFTIDTIDGLQFDVDLSNISFDGLSTNDAINAVVNAINTASTTAGASVTAAAITTGNITTVELTDAGVGVDSLTVTKGPESLAAQYLGIIPSTNTTGQVVSGGTTLTGDHSQYIDLNITASDGQSFGVDLSAATTVGEVLAAIDTATGGVVDARLASSGNGIELFDTTAGPGSLTVTAAEGSQAAEFLGLVATGETQNISTSNTLTGTDRNARETDSVFNSLIRLRDALDVNDTAAIGRAAAKLDNDIERVIFAQADVGTSLRSLELSQQNLQDEEIQLKAALSEEVDVDLVEAISQLTARQISLEASLRATANILQLSLLNFI